MAFPIEPSDNAYISLPIGSSGPIAWLNPSLRSSLFSGSRFSFRHLLLIVGSRVLGLCDIIRIIVLFGGSSKIFNNAFALAFCRSSAESIITTLCPSSVLDKLKNCFIPRTSSILID